VDVRPNDFQKLEVALAPLRASVKIVSEPPEAQVFIDGAAKGTTPLVIPGVEGGEHALRLELDGYAPHTSRFNVEEATPLELRPKLELAARLEVRSEPERARVRVDGRDVGVTPVSLGVKPGPHEVVVELEGYDPSRLPVEAERGQTHRVQATLRETHERA